MNIKYVETKQDITAKDVSRVFEASGIKRPYQDLERMERMIQNADVLITAWHENKMVGLARAITDFSYCCYLSDLAVDKEYQRYGIGRELVKRVKDQIGEESSLILLSSPIAMEYYPKLGFSKADNAYIIKRAK
ncbi:GNAT family N-acetyltransferase [Paenibacillus sp. 1001270B_150601_E10]|uniref:GNAT family N-acetyltransferase n=1 Tax=Paenibacillus sp. 1001270B_150601_E10 TaxID=2787079 RepID=UPI00189D2537|nr:GNAT family N-acetyltransferase [Paenibacillus sp. 1001270B_150601_E10]